MPLPNSNRYPVNGNLKMYKKGEEKMYRIDKEKKNIYNKK